MKLETKAIETTGEIDINNQLILDDPIPIFGPTRVKVIILFPEKAEINEKEWLYTARNNQVFDFLKDPEEDIYTVEDGRPFDDQK